MDRIKPRLFFFVLYEKLKIIQPTDDKGRTILLILDKVGFHINGNVKYYELNKSNK